MTSPTAPESPTRDATPAAVLVAALNRYDDRPCLVVGDQTFTYREFRERVSQVVQAMGSLGLGRHEQIVVLSGNTRDVSAVLVALTALAVPRMALNARGSVEDHAYMLRDADARVLLFDPVEHDEHARQLAAAVPGMRILSLGPCEGVTDLLAAADSFTPAPLRVGDIPPHALDDIATRGYTGGTTGRPKGLRNTHRAVLWIMTIQLAAWDWPEGLLRALVVTPMSHSGAALMYPTWVRGGCLYVMEQHFTPARFFALVAKHRINASLLVPTLIYALLDDPGIGDADLSSLECIYYGAASTSPTRLAEAIERFGPVFFQFYGQAEAPMTVCTLSRREHEPERLGTCGRPVPWMEVALLDEDGNEVPTGTPGEMCARGPLVFAGYHNRPDETAAVMQGGWLHTGDIARRDADGFLTIVDRKKDMIISGGFNVYPREVEDVLTRHPDVLQAAVIGIPDERWGEAVHASIVRRTGGTVTAEELTELVRQAKGSVQAPKSVEFVPSFPVTPVGKVDKKALRAAHPSAATS